MSEPVVIGNTEEDIPRMMEFLHIDEATARFMVALAQGEIDGDECTVGVSPESP